jgi:hypothetical protein
MPEPPPVLCIEGSRDFEAHPANCGQLVDREALK